ncbi:hypothetical protein [Clostridium sp. UBA4395]|uniref:hypothetical protein n=1 Tax=Clostridium sp. UBA4395 TaxID=1946360 RepID=UPI003217C99E
MTFLIGYGSRFKVWTIYSSTSENHLFDFLANPFEILGEILEEILINNALTMMDHTKIKGSKGKINNKFKQLVYDFGLRIVPCLRVRTNTKIKIENLMRIIDNYCSYQISCLIVFL